MFHSLAMHKLNTDRHHLKYDCNHCPVHQICMPLNATQTLLQQLDDLILFRKKIKHGATIYHSGSPFKALYAVKSGYVKTETLLEDGRIQVTGFYMPGEILGFDGIATGEHGCTSVALDDSEICIIAFDVENGFHQSSVALGHHFYQMMSREIVRNYTMMLLLGSMQTEERVAAFLLNLSERFFLRGYPPLELKMRMKREEIASYLGMKIETLSRVLSKFQEQGLLEVHHKNIRIVHLNGLKKAIVKHETCTSKQSQSSIHSDRPTPRHHANNPMVNV